MGRIKRQIRWPRQPPLDPDRPDDPRPAARRHPRAGPARALRGRRRVDPLAGSPPPVRPPFEPAPDRTPPPLPTLGRLPPVPPEPVLRALSAAGGELILWLAPRRRFVLRSNLHHAFPDRPRAWRRRVARESSRRLVETAMLSLAAPFLSERRIRRIARLGPSTEAFAREISARPRPVVLATLHLAHWESQTWLKLISPGPLPAL